MEPSKFHIPTRYDSLSPRALLRSGHLLTSASGFGRIGLRLLAHLLPSFVRHWNSPQEKAGPVSGGRYALTGLNGLRGIACLIVFNYHLIFVFTKAADLSWGTHTDDGDNLHYIQLPFVRLLYAGHAMVIIFFVISGYVLSHKPIRLLRAGKFAEFHHTLTSSVFRRGIRLFAPTILGTFITMLFTWGGYFEAGKDVASDAEVFKGNNEGHPQLFKTFYEQIWNWIAETGALVANVWHWDLRFDSYDPHLWTIPLEFRSSMVLFICLLGFSRLRVVPRLVLMTITVATALSYWIRWEVFLFLAGMIFAELDWISGIFAEASPLDEKTAPRQSRLSSLAWAIMMIMGLFCSSCPSLVPYRAPGYKYLASFAPGGYSWQPGRPLQAIGGCLVVWSFMHLPRVQRVFNSRVAQYFGKISYAFYIVHGPMLHSFGYRLLRHIWTWTGQETALRYGTAIILTGMIMLPLAVWVADLFWRAIDTPCVELARRVEAKLSI